MLAVGTLEPRKNLARVVEATARAGVELRVVGAPGWGDAGVAGKHVTWLGRSTTRSSPRLPRRALPRLPVALRGLRDPGARGDGLRHAGRDERRQRDGGGRGRRRRPRRPARRRLDRRRHRDGRPAARASSSLAAWSGPPTTPGTARSTRPSPPTTGARVTEPLVVIDADVLGRHRTGDETYVRNLLRELGRSRQPPASGSRRSRATPSSCPPGSSRSSFGRGSQELRMLRSLPRLLRRTGAGSRPLPVRGPPSLAVPGGGHDPRPLVRARPGAMGRGPARLQARRPARGTAAPPRAHRLRAHARRPRRALRRPRGEGHRDAERRRPCLHAGEQPRARHLRALRRRGPAAQEPARCARRRARRPLPLVVAGPAKDEALAREPERGGRRPARLRHPGGARRALPRRRLPRAALALRGLRPAGARGDGERHAGRRARRAGAARGRRRRGRLRRRGAPRRRRPARARRARRSSSRPGSSGRRRSPGARPRERTLDVYREALA